MAPSRTETRFVYRLFGMQVDSDWPIAGLAAPGCTNAATELSFKFRERPPSGALAQPKELLYTSEDMHPTGAPVVQLWESRDGGFLHVAYCDGMEFWINRELTVIWVAWPSSSSFESALTYLLGPVLGLLLRLKGVVCLHASAAVIEDYAVVFCGAEGAGKSTTAAGLAKQGFAVLSDDVVALKALEKTEKGSYEVVPAYPRVNLWPTAVRLVYGREDALPAIVEDWDKRYLELGRHESARFEDRSMPLAVVYVLEQDDNSTEIAVKLLPRKDALLSLVANTYATNLLTQVQRAEEFEFLSRLVEVVPVRKLNPRRREWNVSQLCEAIRMDARDIRRAAKTPG